MNKKGSLFFTIDTLIAGFILTLLVLLLMSFITSSPVVEDTKFVLDEYSNHILTTEMRSVSIFVYTLGTQRPDIRNLKIHEKIALLANTDRLNIAQSFLNNLTPRIVQEGHGISYFVDDILIYESIKNPEFEQKIELTTKFMTYFLYQDELIGPNITTIKVWS
jgi:hypothetical protein